MAGNSNLFKVLYYLCVFWPWNSTPFVLCTLLTRYLTDCYYSISIVVNICYISLFNYHPSFWKVNYKKSQFTNWQLNCQIVRKFPARKFKKHTTAHCQNTFLTLCTVLCMCKSAISGNFEYPKSPAREKYWTRVNEGFSSISP